MRFVRERALLTKLEQRVMRTFQQFQVNPGQMLCFYGPNLQQFKPALQELTERELLVEEQFNGGYSLTQAGFVAMKGCK
jgi:hypothetical protein